MLHTLPMAPAPEEPREFVDGGGRRFRRTGFCCRCGACCQGCHNLHKEGEIGVCADYGGAQYRGFGCHTWPSDPGCIAELPGCTYAFEALD